LVEAPSQQQPFCFKQLPQLPAMDKVAPVLGGLATLYVASKVIPVMHPGP